MKTPYGGSVASAAFHPTEAQHECIASCFESEGESRHRYFPIVGSAVKTSPLLPPRPFLGSITIRVALVWCLIRVAAAMGSVGMGIPGPAALIGSWLTVPVVVLFVMLAVCLEMWRQAELVFLANLGYSFGRIAALITAQYAVFEAIMRLAFV